VLSLSYSFSPNSALILRFNSFILSILSIQSISKSFEGRQVLQNISFDLNTSEIYAIIGSSGSGKTTLIRIAAGLLNPDEGKVQFNDEDLEGPDVRLVPGYEEIRLVHQDFKLKHKMTVFENIRYELLAYTPDYQSERINFLLKLCRITHLEKTDISKLSGGEKQRVAIARGLASEPEVLIMDEPFSNLDINTKSVLLEEIKSIAKESNTAILLVTHDPRDAMEVADRVLVLDEGKCIHNTTPKNLYRNPKQRSVANLMGLYNELSAEHLQLLTTKSFNSTHGLWAEDVSIGEGKLSGEVVNITFSGSFTRVKLSWKEHVLYAFDYSHKISIGDKVNFEINEKHLFPLVG
jgi:ABC-type glutathione transport system ATPase component